MGNHFLLQGIFLTLSSNVRFLCLLHCREILYHRATWEALIRWDQGNKCNVDIQSQQFTKEELRVKVQSFKKESGSNLGLLHFRQILYRLSHQGSLYNPNCVCVSHSFVSDSLQLHGL